MSCLSSKDHLISDSRMNMEKLSLMMQQYTWVRIGQIAQNVLSSFVVVVVQHHITLVTLVSNIKTTRKLLNAAFAKKKWRKRTMSKVLHSKTYVKVLIVKSWWQNVVIKFLTVVTLVKVSETRKAVCLVWMKSVYCSTINWMQTSMQMATAKFVGRPGLVVSPQ